MNRKAVVLTDDIYLAQKIRLALSGTVTFISDKMSDAERIDLCFYDLRSGAVCPDSVAVIRIGKGGELDYPFSYEDLTAAVNCTQSAPKPLLNEEGFAIVRGERIKLTEVEYALFDILYSAGGEYVSRERIIKDVWGGRADGGVVNVYVHYLRSKLEKGEKIILSSRNLGYKIDEKYFEATV